MELTHPIDQFCMPPPTNNGCLEADHNGGGYFAQVRKNSVALRDGPPVRPRAQLAGFAGCRKIRLITRSGRYRVA
jgi:hypothetical protein